MTKTKARALMSTVLLVALIICFITGVILFFLDVGMWWIFTRKFLTDVHNISGFVFGGGSVVHFIINIRVYRHEMRLLRQQAVEPLAPEDQLEDK